METLFPGTSFLIVLTHSKSNYVTCTTNHYTATMLDTVHCLSYMILGLQNILGIKCTPMYVITYFDFTIRVKFTLKKVAAF